MTVMEETLACTDNLWFDYESTLALAEKGDPKALKALFEVSKITDAAGALGHGDVLYKLLTIVGDETFAANLRGLPTADLKAVNDRLDCGLADADVFEQDVPIERRKSFPDIYPSTYSVLHGVWDRTSCDGWSRRVPIPVSEPDVNGQGLANQD